MTVTLI